MAHTLAKALKQLRPDVRLIGVGGQHMHAAGVELIRGLHRVDAVGVPGAGDDWEGDCQRVDPEADFQTGIPGWSRFCR